MKEKDLWLVDGYNIIFQDKMYWCFHEEDINHSCELLQNKLLNAAAHKGIEMILVFDGNKSQFAGEEKRIAEDFTVVFTDPNETADSYIERVTYLLKDQYRDIFVATSDSLEQSQVMGVGAYRLSARELMNWLQEDQDEQAEDRRQREMRVQRISVADHLSEDAAALLEKIRRQNG